MASRPAPAVVLEQVTLLGDETLTEGVIVELADEHETHYFPRLILAARTASGQVGVWAINSEDLLTIGPIFALDGAAREFSNWGAAGKGDSRFEVERMQILKYPEVAEARAALR